MSCFPCFQSQKNKKSNSKREYESPSGSENAYTAVPETKKQKPDIRETDQEEKASEVDQSGCTQAHSFTFRELATATKNFRQECSLGEGGFGKVFRGTLASTGQVVAVKQLDKNGMQGTYTDFLNEVEMLSLLSHQNLVSLIGYCADGDQRLLVYELMPGGSLEDNLHGTSPQRKPLDWIVRIKIAIGAAKGLVCLHEEVQPPVIFRDLKPSNILLDKELNPKLSDYGLAKLNPSGAKMHVVMGTYGYYAPEYTRSSTLTLKSDVYSFGVILLELITGRRAIDTTKPTEEQNLVSWAQPIFRDPKRFPDMADPLLNRHYPEKDLNQAVAIAAMCLQEEAAARPLMSDVLTALSFLSISPQDCIPPPTPPSTPPREEKDMVAEEKSNKTDGDSSDSEDSSSESEEESDEEDQRDGERGGGEDSFSEGNEVFDCEENGPERPKTEETKSWSDDETYDADHGYESSSSKDSSSSLGSSPLRRSRRSTAGSSNPRSSSRKSGIGSHVSRSSNSNSSFSSHDSYDSFHGHLSTGSQNEHGVDGSNNEMIVHLARTISYGSEDDGSACSR